MLIQVIPSIEASEFELLNNKLQQFGYKTHDVKTQTGHYIICNGKAEVDIRLLGRLAGVKDVHYVSDDYKLVSRQWR